MRILTVVSDLGKGGTQRTAQVFAEAYRQLLHDSRLLAVYELGSRYDELKDVIPVWHGLSDKNLQTIKDWHPDIIHIHTHCLKDADVRRLLVFVRNEFTKVVETNVFSAPSPWAEMVDVSFQLSVWALWLFQLRGGAGKVCTVVPNPVDCRKFSRKSKSETAAFRKACGIPEGAFIIGRIGQPAEFSWSPMLVRIFNDLAVKYENLYLVVVGASPPVLNQIAESPYADRVVVISEIIGDENLSVAYSSFDLMAHVAAGGESFGLVNAESILCGTPVVTLSTPWISNSQCEVVGNMKGGYVVHRLKGMKKAVEHFMKNGDALGLVEKGGEHIRKNYDHRRVAEMAVNCAFNPPAADMNGGGSGRIGEILKDSFDRPGLLTSLLISLNTNAARKWTIYSSAYRPLRQLPLLARLELRCRKIPGG